MTRAEATPLIAYILAGGLSTRFGSDKARVPKDGRARIVALAEALTASIPDVTVVARTPGAYADLGLRTIADRHPGLGPLGGLDAGLADRLARCGPGWIALLACDWSGFDPPLLELLSSRRAPGRRVVAFRDSRWQPLLALYHTDLLPDLSAWLAAGNRTMWRFLEHVHAYPVAPDPLHPLPINLNTPTDAQ